MRTPEVLNREGIRPKSRYGLRNATVPEESNANRGEEEGCAAYTVLFPSVRALDVPYPSKKKGKPAESEEECLHFNRDHRSGTH